MIDRVSLSSLVTSTLKPRSSTLPVCGPTFCRFHAPAGRCLPMCRVLLRRDQKRLSRRSNSCEDPPLPPARKQSVGERTLQATVTGSVLSRDVKKRKGVLRKTTNALGHTQNGQLWRVRGPKAARLQELEVIFEQCSEDYGSQSLYSTFDPNLAVSGRRTEMALRKRTPSPRLSEALPTRIKTILPAIHIMGWEDHEPTH